MAKKIQQLSSGVVKKLRSGIAFINVAHCVEELVLNSVDAGANCIAVHLNLPFYQIQVIDNGCGIALKQMKMIGTRYATSKCHTLEDLQNLKSGGFRGEALSSLKEVSSVLMIESRTASANETYCKIFTQGKSSDPKKSLNSRPSKGTTVSVYDFMYNMPVRKNSISETLDLEECRKLLQSIALMHPNISFTLKNETSGEMILQLKKCTSLYHAFLQMFGKSKASNLKNIDYQRDEYEINGCINTDCHISKDLQFLYVNKRQVLRTKLHKLINSILNKTLSSRQKSNVIANNITPDGSSPSKNQCICIFALNISCSYDKYDIIFEPRKTMIEFSDWQTVLKVVEDSLIDFLKKENLYSNADESEASISNVNFVANFNNSNFDVQDCKQGGLFSNAVRRLQLVSEFNDPNKNYAAQGNIEDITHKNSEEGSISVSNPYICSTPELFILNCAENDSTSKKSISVNCERKTKLFDQESCICPNAEKFNVSILDNLKSATSKSIITNSTNLENCSISCQEIELGIPCRSVFPSESPVMLRVPVKSTLSDLQTSSSDSNFLRLKEKFQYLPKKEKTYQLNESKFDKKHAKVCLKFNNVSNTLSFKNRSLQTQSHLGFNEEESETKECNELNLKHKSSQYPSVSLEKVQKEQHSSNIYDSEENERSSLKTAKDKSVQCPSATSEKKVRIVSRFRFEKEPTKLSLQCFRQSGKLERKSLRKTCNEEDIIATAEDLLNDINNDNEMSKAKKLRFSPSILSGNSVSDIVKTTEAIENNEMNIEILPNVRVSSEVKNLSNFYSAHELDDLSANISVNSAPETFIISETKETKIVKLSEVECSTFSLQTFTKTKDIENSAHSVHVLTGIDVNCMFEKDNIDISTPSDQVNDHQNFLTNDMSVEVIDDLKSFKEHTYDLADMDLDSSFKSTRGTLVSENKLSEFEISKQNDSTENMHLEMPKVSDIVENMRLELGPSEQSSTDTGILSIDSKIVTPYLDNMKSGVNNSDSDFRKESGVFSYHNVESLKNDKIDIQLESPPVVDVQNQILDNLEENSLSYNEVGMQYSRNHSTSTSEEKSFSDINFESDPFTENLPPVSEDYSLKQKSVKKNNNNKYISNDIPVELSKEPPFTELLNMDVEISDYYQKSNNTSIEASVCNFEMEDVEQNQSKNIVEKENTTNVYSTSTGVNDAINLPVCTVDDKIDYVENRETLSEKKSENPNRWKLHSESKSKRTVYIDTVTGNSAYVVPEQPKIVVNQNVETNNNNTIENMLNEWDNPMFDIPYEVTSITNNKISQNVSQMYSFLNSYRFSKATLSSLQVIGQVDCKFIACILRDFNENCKDQRLLALFDQHAVHERVRLEELTEDLYKTDQDGAISVKTSSIHPPLQVTFEDEEIRLLHTYHEKLQRIGIHMNIDNESNVCNVHSVPACLVYKDTQELRRSVSDSIVVLQNSVKEWLTSLLKTRSIPQMLPKTLLSVLNYQACRGAVKFGDPLTLEQCRDLLKSLAECKLPFQCAHGRPSVAPILDLKKIEGLYKKRPPPQLWTITAHLQK